MLELFDGAGEFNAARWVLLSSWSAWVMVGVALLAVGVVALAWHNGRSLRPSRRRALLALRVATVLILGALFLQPGVRLEHVTRVRNHVVMLVDSSRSMSLPGEDGRSRLDGVRAMMERAEDTLADWRTRWLAAKLLREAATIDGCGVTAFRHGP